VSDGVGYVICFCLGSFAMSLILITVVLRQIRDELRKVNQ
jgi:hypothetical protein